MNNNPMQMFMQMLNMGGNPQQIIQNMVNKNPQMQQQLNILNNQIQQSGLSPQQFAMQYAKQNNINIQPFVNMMNQRGIKL